jgi:uroporphyrin-III C-methyltransferase/precorrin-2 dehydrogenase/sirohydrochlorin ferrochelatase
MISLPLFHRIEGQPVILIGAGDAAAAKRRLILRAGGLPVEEADERARLAFVATDDDLDPTPIVARLRARGLLVNCADRPELCDFTLPAIVDRAPVLVAIGTGGASAGLAKALRLRLEALLSPELGRLAEALHAARDRLRARWPDAAQRRRAIDAALAGPLEAPRIEAWLADAADPPGETVPIILRSPDPDDLTLREARLLGSADVIAHAADVPQPILDRARADAIRMPLEAAPTGHPGLVLLLTFDRLSASAGSGSGSD